MGRIRAIGLYARVIWWVVRAACRMAWRYHAYAFDQAMCTVHTLCIPGTCDIPPELLARMTERLLPWLPPWRMGRCVKRSLILLHLWSRCGIPVRLHIGIHPSQPYYGHVWLSVPPQWTQRLEAWCGLPRCTDVREVWTAENGEIMDTVLQRSIS